MMADNKPLPRCQECGQNDAAWMVVAGRVPGLGVKRRKMCTPCAEKQPATSTRRTLRRREY